MTTDLGSMFNAALRQKTYAEMLAEQSASTAPTPSWGAALARALQGGLAGMYERQDQAAQAGAFDKMPGMGGALSGPPSVSTPMGSPRIPPDQPPRTGGLQYPDRTYGQNEMTPLDAGVATPKELATALSMSQPDFDKTARTVVGEAGNQPPIGQQAVANVILNRGRLSGQSPSQLITPGQFEPWASPEGRARMGVGTDTPAYQQAAQAVYAAGQADPTGGATKFYSPGAQAALGRPPPKWEDSTGQDIGGQRFFRQPFAGQEPGSASATMALAPVSGPSNPIPEPKPVPTQIAQAGGQPIMPQQSQQGAQPGRSVPQIPDEVQAQIRALGANPATRGQAWSLYQQYMAPKETWTPTVGPDGTPLQKNSLTGEVKAIPRETAITEVEYARNHWQQLGLPDPSATDPKSQNFWKEYNAKRLGGAGVNVSIDQSAPSEFEKEYGKGMSARALKVLESGDKAASDIQNVQLMRSLLNDIKTGKFASGQATIGAWLQAAGIDPSVMNIDPKLPATAEIATSLMNKMTLANIGGEGGMPSNNFSNTDRSFIQKIVPAMRNRPEANDILLAAKEREAQLSIERADRWADARANGTSYEKFEREWRKDLASRDVFGDLAAKASHIGQFIGPPMPQGALPAGGYTWDPQQGLAPR